MSATLTNDTMRLIQLNRGRLAKLGSFTWVQMPVWPLRLTLSSAPSPLYFMTTEGLDLAPMPRQTVSMINLGTVLNLSSFLNSFKFNSLLSAKKES